MSVVNTGEAASPAEPFEETREELKRRLEAQKFYARTVKLDMERSQRKMMTTQARVHELQTALGALEAHCVDALKHIVNREESAAASVASADGRVAAANDRLKIVPCVDRSLRGLAFEVSGLMTTLRIAPQCTAAEANAISQMNVLELVEQIRYRIRTACATVRMKHTNLTPPEKVRAADDVRVDEHSMRANRETESSTNSDPGMAVLMLSREDAKLPRQSDVALHERNAELARRECAATKQENRKLLKQIKDLQVKAKKAEQLEVSAITVERARSEAADARKSATIAVNAKRAEVESLQRNHSVQLQTVLADVSKMKRSQLHEKQLAARLAQSEERVTALEQQLKRSGIERASKEVDRLSTMLESTKMELEHTAARLREVESVNEALRRDARSSADRFNALFAAHVADDRKRLQAQQEARVIAVQNAVVSNAGGVEEIEQRNADLGSENNRLKRKLNRVLVAVRHEELERSVPNTVHQPAAHYAAAGALERRASLEARSPERERADLGRPSPVPFPLSRSGAVVTIAAEELAISAIMPASTGQGPFGVIMEPVEAVEPHDGEVSRRAVDNLERNRTGERPHQLQFKRRGVGVQASQAHMYADFGLLLGGPVRASTPAGVALSLQRKRMNGSK